MPVCTSSAQLDTREWARKGEGCEHQREREGWEEEREVGEMRAKKEGDGEGCVCE